MSASPEQTIRRYLDEHGGDTTATVDHLLMTFGVEEDDQSGRDRIRSALSRAGVEIDRPLPFLGRDEQVHLSVADSNRIDSSGAALSTGAGDVEGTQAADDQSEKAAAPQHPAAWYSDARVPGQLRWWDGSKWTDHVQPQQNTPRESPAAQSAGQRPLKPGERPVLTQAEQQASQVRQSQGRSQPPWYKRPWVIVVGAILAIIIIAAAASSSGDKEGEGGQAAKNSEPSAEESGAGKSESKSKGNAEKPNEATDGNTPHVGPDQKVTVDGLVYSVKSAKTAKSLGDPSIGTDETADGVFVIVRIGVHSTKGETAQLSDDTFKLETKGGPSYSTDTEGSTAALLASGSGGGAEEPFFLRDVQPDTTTKGLIVFDVPPGVLKKNPELRFNELGFGESHGFIALPPL